MSSPTPYTVRLNNFLAQRKQDHLLSKLERQEDGQWKIEYKVNGELKGSGSAQQKRSAQEAAARETLRSLGGNV